MVRLLAVVALVALTMPAGAEPNECSKLARRASAASGLSIAKIGLDAFDLQGRGKLAGGQVGFLCSKRILFAGWNQSRAPEPFVHRVAKAAAALNLIGSDEADSLVTCQNSAFIDRGKAKEIIYSIGKAAKLTCQSGRVMTFSIRPAP